MARYYDITIDGDGGVLTLEGGASQILQSGSSLSMEDGSQLIVSGNTALAAFRSGAVLNIGQDGVSSGYVDMWQNSSLRLRDNSALQFLSGSIMRGTVNLDTGLTISGGNLSTSGDLAIESGADLDIKSGAEIHIEDGGGIIVEPGGQVTVNSGASLNFNSASWIQGTPLLGDGASNSGIMYVLANGEIRLYDTGGKLTVESDSHGDGIVLTGGTTASLVVTSTGQLTCNASSTVTFNNAPTFNAGMLLNPSGGLTYSSPEQVWKAVPLNPTYLEDANEWPKKLDNITSVGQRSLYWNPNLYNGAVFDAYFEPTYPPTYASDVLRVKCRWYGGGSWSHDADTEGSLTVSVVRISDGQVIWTGSDGTGISKGILEVWGDLLVDVSLSPEVYSPTLHRMIIRVRPPELNIASTSAAFEIHHLQVEHRTSYLGP
jgi:hypothetical protein